MFKLVVRHRLPHEGFKKGGVQQNTKASADKFNKSESLVRDPGEVICFDCDQAGHYREGCAVPRRLRSYKCKALGFTTRNCPKCSGNARKKQ